MLGCAPPMGQVVTRHFHYFGINQEKKINTVLMKQNHIIELDM